MATNMFVENLFATNTFDGATRSSTSARTRSGRVSGHGPDRTRWAFDALLNGALDTPAP